ncbi:ankyrin repeat domain-containing protein [Paenibacillus sp. MMS20-IR301]|uniref:ankyrin repeat domain-containing protein n=1 Tax=Paenibacillus sp. MMS20-IR301 TaxID=2895946 RepID=UPI0028EA9D71|nr:ankyrin repeat domain-containing protein [Paenibacillus sp. MMS20-IR301]WNS44908.1 ankyrin repeat domain-containing protein [Paenibacillus sp. MMS20-IR301]
MGKKRKTLPADFDERIKTNDIAVLQEILNKCEWDARGGYSKGTALSFRQIPDELVRWLVQQGADIDARDTYQRTPLHAQAATWSGNIPLFLELGADPEAVDYQDETPLHAAAGYYRTRAIQDLVAHDANIHAVSKRKQTPLAKGLSQCRNIDITHMAGIAKIMLDAGAVITPEMKDSVRRIGKDLEFVRASHNNEELDKKAAALLELYRLFDVEPVAKQIKHDGSSPIKAAAAAWPAQHQELWDFLVPASGHAQTVQGEVIRITGRVSHEILDNGGGNWDDNYREMLDALLRYMSSATPLSHTLLQEAELLVSRLRKKGYGNDEPARLSELAVQWVAANPLPVSMEQPDYKR